MLFKNMFDVELYEQYLKDKKNLSSTSLYLYTSTIEKFLAIYEDIDSIEPYNDYIIKHAIKKRSNYVYSVLKSFIEYYIKDSSDRATMLENLIKPEIKHNIKRERKYLEENQIISIINNLKHVKHKVIALIQDMTGLRCGDVLRIKRGDIVPELYKGKNVLKMIITGKGGKRSVVYIHDYIIQSFIVDYIINNVNNTGYYFMERSKNNIKGVKYTDGVIFKYNYKIYYRDMKSAMYKIGLSFKDFATHDLRRCFARRVWTRYKDIQVLKELLNHVNPATTMRYLKQSGMSNIDYHKEMQER